MSMMYFVVVDPLLIFLSLRRMISGNVSYIMTMKTMKVEVVLTWRTFSCYLDSFGRLRLLVVSLLEFRLTSYSFGMSG